MSVFMGPHKAWLSAGAQRNVIHLKMVDIINLRIYFVFTYNPKDLSPNVDFTHNISQTNWTWANYSRKVYRVWEV